MPIVELTGVITKPFVLMIRLFANMLAGHMIVAVFISLIFVFNSLMGPAAGYAISPVSVGFSVFILLLDVLVSFIQAYVFTLLSALYFGMATTDHH
jgi:F-type H+-transporting ATPase subunit a